MTPRIPNQYSFGFGRKIIPVEERAYGQFVGKAISINGFMGIFIGSHQSPDGLILHFSEKAMFTPKGIGRIEKGDYAITVRGDTPIATIPMGLSKFLESQNKAINNKKSK